MTYFDIHLVGKKNKTLLVSSKTTILFIKNKLYKSPENIEIIYKGEILQNENTLGYYHIVEDDILYYHSILFLEKQKNNTITDSLNNIVSMLGSLVNLPTILQTESQMDYNLELDQLSNMGFTDTEHNMNLLNLYGGNVEAVANILLGI